MADTQTRYTPARRMQTLYRRVFHKAKPFRGHLGALLTLGLLGTPLDLLMPLPVTIAVDSVIGGKPLTAAVSGWVPEGLIGTPLLLAVGLVVATALLTQVHAQHLAIQ